MPSALHRSRTVDDRPPPGREGKLKPTPKVAPEGVPPEAPPADTIRYKTPPRARDELPEDPQAAPGDPEGAGAAPRDQPMEADRTLTPADLFHPKNFSKKANPKPPPKRPAVPEGMVTVKPSPTPKGVRPPPPFLIMETERAEEFLSTRPGWLLGGPAEPPIARSPPPPPAARNRSERPLPHGGLGHGPYQGPIRPKLGGPPLKAAPKGAVPSAEAPSASSASTGGPEGSREGGTAVPEETEEERAKTEAILRGIDDFMASVERRSASQERPAPKSPERHTFVPFSVDPIPEEAA
ncbi:unnamed protein product, partial [Symbiodinium sp. CCMP2592]